MYFVFRDGRYIDAAGRAFRDFLEGKLPALPGEKPTLGDWTDHLSTLSRGAAQELPRDARRRLALDAIVPGGGTVLDLSHEVVAPPAGLRDRVELTPPATMAASSMCWRWSASGKTFAEKMRLDRYHGDWNGDVSYVYGENSF